MAAVVSWAGTSGVLPLAAALSIPLAAHDGSPLPDRGLVLVLTTAVVIFTLDRVRRNYLARLQQGDELNGQGPDEGGLAPSAYYRLRREAITIQTTEPRRRYDEHQISDATRRQLQHELDLEEAGLPDTR